MALSMYSGRSSSGGPDLRDSDGDGFEMPLHALGAAASLEQAQLDGAQPQQQEPQPQPQHGHEQERPTTADSAYSTNSIMTASTLPPLRVSVDTWSTPPTPTGAAWQPEWGSSGEGEVAGLQPIITAAASGTAEVLPLSQPYANGQAVRCRYCSSDHHLKLPRMLQASHRIAQLEARNRELRYKISQKQQRQRQQQQQRDQQQRDQQQRDQQQRDQQRQHLAHQSHSVNMQDQNQLQNQDDSTQFQSQIAPPQLLPSSQLSRVPELPHNNSDAALPGASTTHALQPAEAAWNAHYGAHGKAQRAGTAELKSLSHQLKEANAMIKAQTAALAAVRRDNSRLVEANRKLKVELGQRGGLGSLHETNTIEDQENFVEPDACTADGPPRLGISEANKSIVDWTTEPLTYQEPYDLPGAAVDGARAVGSVHATVSAGSRYSPAFAPVGVQLAGACDELNQANEPGKFSPLPNPFRRNCLLNMFAYICYSQGAGMSNETVERHSRASHRPTIISSTADSRTGAAGGSRISPLPSGSRPVATGAATWNTSARKIANRRRPAWALPPPTGGDSTQQAISGVPSVSVADADEEFFSLAAGPLGPNFEYHRSDGGKTAPAATHLRLDAGMGHKLFRIQIYYFQLL
eukprot:SAG31_NODE_1993_length_6709_cov_5.744024_8_plen_635_part_00